MPIDLYSLPASGPCRAVIMTAQHLKLKLNVKNVDLFGGEQMKPEFLRMNPQHCVPTIDDDGFYLWESRAVQTYLVNKYAPDSSLYPKDPKARAVVDRMLFFDIGTLYATQGEWLRPQLFLGKPSDPEKEEAFRKSLALLEEFLGKTRYVAGENITLADFSIFSTLTFAETMNPQHCVPTIDDDGFYLWESRAVQTYLVNKYAPDSSLYPKDPKARAVVDRMLFFDIGTLFATLYPEWLRPQLFFGKPADPEREEAFRKTLALLDEFLSKTSYVAGENITLADFSIFSTLTFAETVAGFNFESFLRTNAWLQKLKTEVPNYKEIHEIPLREFKEYLKSRSKK